MLLRSLLHLSLAEPGTVDLVRSQQELSAASDLDWQATCVDLERHRLQPLVFHGVKSHGLLDRLPRAVASQLLDVYFYSLQRNLLFFKTLGAVLGPIQAAGIQPVLWKGVILADQIYPSMATRMVGDIDWAIAPDELQTVSHIFEQLGFKQQLDLDATDAVYFKNADRVLFDVHYRVRLFEGKEHWSLTQEITPASSLLPQLCCLEPNAMLAHLTAHLSGHVAEMGPLLFWVLDFVFLLRRWGDQIVWDRLDALLPSPENRLVLGRVLRFLQVEFAEPLPPVLAQFAQAHQPITLEAIVRQCRFALWGLPAPKGWLKLAVCRMGMHSSQGNPYPSMEDLWLGMTDAALQGDR
ncbi:MAG: nucleotidyltransferase family protein [Thermosynechococcaceae cyanobacterium]